MNETQRNAAADAAIKLGILAALCMLASGYLIGGMQGVGVALGIVATLLCIVVFAYAAGTKT